MLADTSDATAELARGTLLTTDNTVDTASGTIEAKAQFANGDGALTPGQFVSVRLQVGNVSKGIAVPQEAVQHGQDGLFVLLVKPDKTAERRPVDVAYDDGTTAVVTKGVADGDRVVVSGQSRVGSGTHLALHDDADPDGKRPAAAECAEMSVSAPFIRRPIATSLVIAAIFLAGLAAYPFLPVAPLPPVEFPTMSVTANYPGASPDTMATAVATPLETQFGQIPGLSQMTSVNVLGTSQITLQFDLSRNIDAAATDVLAAINAAGGQLPKDMPNPPTFRKTNPADAPILILAVDVRRAAADQVDDYAENILAQQLSQVSGVSQVLVGGQQTPAVRVQVDPARLAALG